MYVNPFQISMDTLIGAAPLLGHGLEDRSGIRERQDPALVQWLQSHSSRSLRDASQQNLFCVAPLDILFTEGPEGRKFHLIEINGTGIGGLTNLTGTAVSAVLASLSQFAETCPDADPVILVASSGLEADGSPRLNRLIHEKILYAEALKRGFDYAGHPARVVTMAQIQRDPTAMPAQGPTIVLGYMKQLLSSLEVDDAGRLLLQGRQVQAAVNDRFCINVLHEFPNLDLDQFQTLNRGFLAGADKGVAYDLLNDHRAENASRFFEPVASARAHDRDELIAIVLEWLRAGRQAVIKPQGTGLGHGIEFFLRSDEDEASIIARIDASLVATEEQYGLVGGAFPYTVCDFIDAAAIDQEAHPLHGHKCELRIVVYRDGMKLKAFPSIVKVASTAYDPTAPDRASLINNITTSAEATQRAGSEFMLPLANRETLELLGLGIQEVTELCEAATSFMRFVLDQVQDEPSRFGLPVPAIPSV